MFPKEIWGNKPAAVAGSDVFFFIAANIVFVLICFAVWYFIS